jgi:circadian clock protein KaiC
MPPAKKLLNTISDPKSQDSQGRCSTGVPGFDRLIEGGLVYGSSNVLAGGCGSGKSTFAMQFLYHGAMNGEPGIYVSFEQEPDDLRAMAARFKMGLPELEAKGLISIISVDPSKIMNLVKEGYGQIVEEIRKMGARRVVVDSLSAFEIMMTSDFERRRVLFGFSRWLRRNGCTTILISEIGQSIAQERDFDVSEFMADGVIVLYDVLQQSVRERAIEVLKMRQTKILRKICPFRFEENGLVVYPDEEIFTMG